MSTVAAKTNYTTIEVAGREVRLSNPDKLFFPKPKFTKLDLAEYYIAVEEAAVNQLRERPGTMKRFVDGVGGDFFFQKRVPKGAPEWLQTATFVFPSGRSATELVVNDAAHLVWAVNLGVVDFNPHPVRREDLDHPDELRVDLDPMPGVRWNPEDLRFARDPRQRADRAVLGLRRGPARRAGARARGRAEAAQERHQQVVEGGAPRGLRRLQPERPRPDDRLGVLGAARAGREGVLPSRVG
jgi:hypothetical protein